jgi:hypothetical protein
VSARLDRLVTGGNERAEAIVRRLEFPFSTDPVDAPLGAPCAHCVVESVAY